MFWKRIAALFIILIDEIVFTTFFFVILPIFDLYPPLSSYLSVMAILIIKDIIIIKLIWNILVKPPLLGKESLIGKTGIAHSDLNLQGWARIDNEFWRCEASEFIAKGELIVVTAVHGLILKVESLDKTPT
ncbi:MAG: NfeD family protein [Theionarchaea archaeon]|nr:NfeD family protein [Theionarchaea archaeon]